MSDAPHAGYDPDDADTWIDPPPGTDEARERQRKRKPNGKHGGPDVSDHGQRDEKGGDENSPPPEDDAAAIRRLARLKPLDYERIRDSEAQRLGCRVSMLDRLVRMERGDGATDAGQGRPLDLPSPVPWPQPIADGAALIEEIGRYFTTYAILPEHGATLLALWAIHTHCFAIWRYTPRLHITAATKRAGKSRVLRLLKLIVCKPLAAENITLAAVFRSVAAVQPCLLIDEADVSLKDNFELVSILNSGHEHGGAAVRTTGDDHEPRQFDTFAPVAVAGIGRLPGTLADRAVQLPMRRAMRSERPAKLTSDTEATAARLLRQIARWTADHRQRLIEAKPDMGELINRTEDNWTPLFAIAAVAGGDLLAAARSAATALAPDDDDADSLGERLLHDVRQTFNAWIAENPGAVQHEMASAEIVKRLHAIEGRPWAEMPGPTARPLTTNALARLLRPFKVFPTDVGHRDARVKGYRLLSFSEAFDRHLTPLRPSEGG
jgi:putative DNA primase/helicase